MDFVRQSFFFVNWLAVVSEGLRRLSFWSRTLYRGIRAVNLILFELINLQYVAGILVVLLEQQAGIKYWSYDNLQ